MIRQLIDQTIHFEKKPSKKVYCNVSCPNHADEPPFVTVQVYNYTFLPDKSTRMLTVKFGKIK